LRLVQTAQELAQSGNWLSLADMADELLRTAQDLRSAKREWAGAIFGWLGVCYKRLGQYTKAIELHEQCLTVATELGDRAGQGGAWGNLGNCYKSLGQYTKAIEHHEQHLAIAEEVGDRAGQGAACENLGYALAKNGDDTGAAQVLCRGLAVLQRVEEDVGAHDDRRVSLFEEQQTTYTLLQDVSHDVMLPALSVMRTLMYVMMMLMLMMKQ
jgi:tetratricopeptide (TPR) repeat protein